MIDAIILLVGFILGYGSASLLLSRQKFIVKTANGETTIEPLNKPRSKVEFLPEMTRAEVEEAEKSTSMQVFLQGFRKPEKETEEEI